MKNELLVSYTDKDFKGKSAHELLIFLKKSKLDEAMQQLTKLCELALTLPATSASVERSFSHLKHIHTYSRNAQADKRLSNLAVISIEKKLLKSVKNNEFYDEGISLFNQSERRIELTYK